MIADKNQEETQPLGILTDENAEMNGQLAAHAENLPKYCLVALTLS